MINIAQISDLHLFAGQEEKFHGIYPWQTYNQVIKLLKQNIYDALIVTGDITEDSCLDAYANFILTLRDLNIPVYYVFGNHDDKKCFFQITQVLPAVRQNKFFVMGNWCFILLDSCIPGQHSGVLVPEEINFLKNTLQEHKEMHIAIFLHHNPISVHSAVFDDCMLTNADEFLGIVTSHSNVKIVAFGHVHQEFATTISGVPFLSAPATSAQFKPGAAELTIDDEVTPGFREFILNYDGSFSTRVCRV